MIGKQKPNKKKQKTKTKQKQKRSVESWIFKIKKTRPHSQGIRGSTTVVASSRRTKAPIGQSALKIISLRGVDAQCI
jgi:hypothetical protein